MKQHIVISAVGGDRVGMVHELSKAVTDCGGVGPVTESVAALVVVDPDPLLAWRLYSSPLSDAVTSETV